MGAGLWAPLFPLGAGLSYTTFALSALALPAAALPVATPSFALNVTVSNTGAMGGSAVVFAAVSVRVAGVLRYARRLAAFSRVAVAAGGSAPLSLTVRLQDLERWDPGSRGYVVDAGEYALEVGLCLSSEGVVSSPGAPCEPLKGSVALV